MQTHQYQESTTIVTRTRPSTVDARHAALGAFRPSSPTEPTYTLGLANQELMKLCQQWGLSQDFPT